MPYAWYDKALSVRICTPYPRRVRKRSLDDKPASPNALDDEFETVSLDPKWVRTGTGGSTFDDATAIDPYAAFAAGHRSSHNSYRKSWLMGQPAATANFPRYHQLVTLPTDCFVWARMSFNFRYSAQATGDHGTTLSLNALSAGAPDDNNRVWTALNFTGAANVVRATGGTVIAGVLNQTNTADVGSQTVGTDSQCQQFQYVGLQKLDTTYRHFVGAENGNWIFVRSSTFSSTVGALVIYFVNISSTTPGNMIHGVDFVRVINGNALP